ncbi:MAG: hypothetical protein E7266_09125 [Lachnospiraceae bacterium]|nr:hypothetical protein [Lachnospiraceae bacterium]
MKFISKLERKFGRFAIRNLTIYILIGYVIGYIVQNMSPEIYSYLVMNPSAVLRGEVWRLFTWIITPPESMSLFIIFMFLFFYWVGSSLENALGTFRYNIYIFSGIIFMTVGAMLTYVVLNAIDPLIASYIPIQISTYYINLTSFLAFAVCFPHMQVYVMFVIPLKVKWLAVIDLVLIALEFISIEAYYTMTFVDAEMLNMYTNLGAENAVEIAKYISDNYKLACNMEIWSQRVMLLVPLLNFAIFFLMTRNLKRVSPAEIKRKHNFKKQMEAPVRKGQPRHQCVVCGRTELDNEELVFRYCSKCSGNYEYCQDHIFTHEHK